MRILYIVLIMGLICAFIPGSVAAADGDWKISISFDKAEYKQNEPIYINFKLKNEGKNAVYVNKRFYINTEDSLEEGRDVFLSVMLPSGKKLQSKESRPAAGLPKTDYFILLNPGEEVNSERKRDVRYYFDFKQPGAYKISATYHNVYGEEIGINVLKDKVVSEPVTIRIVE